MPRGHSPPACGGAKERGKGTGSEILMAPFTVHDLEKRVRDRAQAEPGASYTRTLLDKGLAHCAKKLGEEAVEVAIAAIAEDRSRVVAETADLLYHLLVVWAACGVKPKAVYDALEMRRARSGLAEKKARKKRK